MQKSVSKFWLKFLQDFNMKFVEINVKISHVLLKST